MSAEEQATAVLAALNAVLVPKTLHAYDYDQVPAERPTSYVEITVSRRFGGLERMPGQYGSTGWRITTRAVSQKVSNARLCHELARQALENARLTVAGSVTGPIQFETEDPVGPDDKWFSGMSSWTYTHGGNPNA